jgi:pimeloyl-ACP methyl ester carboxylesterase
MLLRRTALALALAALACEPSISSAINPSAVDYAAFDPTGNPPSIPLPNDLALQPQAIAAQSGAQQALLQEFLKAGGFPNDQEVPITIDFVRLTIDANTGASTRSAPALDVSSINSTNLIVLSFSTGGYSSIAYDPPTSTDYVVNGDHGTLTLHKSRPCVTSPPSCTAPDAKTTRRWDPGHYVVAVRGGPGAVKVSGSNYGLQPQPAMYLLLQDKDLSLPQNQSLIPGNSIDEKRATGALLEGVRQGYILPQSRIDEVWGPLAHRQLAIMGTFAIANVQTHVETDPSSGQMPLPSDFLLGADGHLLPELAAPTGPFGALGPGLATLDGFSTTAMVLAATSGAIDANTVTGSTVFLYELNLTSPSPSARRLVDIAEALGTGHPERIAYVSEPPPISQAAVSGGACSASPTEKCLSTAIGLQPAVPAQAGPNFFAVPPLKEGTTYVVLISDGVKDINGNGLTRSTLAKILLMDPSLTAAVNGKSTIAGVTDAQALGIDQMRQAIALAAGTLAVEKPAITRSHLAMAYTFRTQGGKTPTQDNSMKTAATNLAALPYGAPLTTINPVAGTTKLYCAPALSAACTAGLVTDALSAYGVDRTVVPNVHIGYVVETVVPTFNKLLCNAGDPNCKDTGAFGGGASATPVIEPIKVLIALPPPPYTLAAGGACTPNTPPGTICSIPLIVFRHGIGGARNSMLKVADELNNKGFAVAAIDAPKHGDRSYCKATSECASGACVADPALVNEGDAPPGPTPGHCMSGSTPTDFVRDTDCAGCTNTASRPKASGNFLISGNLFRTRDSFRQDIIDQSQLIRVLSPNPACDVTAALTAANTCANNLITASTLVQIDPARIFFVGQSLGAISGVVDVAANARIRKAALNVGGSTFVDVSRNSAAFSGTLDALLASLGITDKRSSKYLVFINVAKWILDPSDPENFAANLTTNTLPGPLSGGVAPPARAVMGQLALCDTVVPNPFSLNLYAATGLGPILATSGTGTVTTFIASNNASCPAGAVAHDFLTNWATYGPAATSITLKAQDDIAAFFSLGTQPPVTQSTP